MIRSISAVCFSIIFILLLFNEAYAWTISRDFEGGSVGQEADSHSSGLDSCVPKFTFSNSRSKSGSQAGKLEWGPGATARGGRLIFPTSLHEGDEIWYRTYIYFESGFNFAAEPAIKIMRVWTASDAGDNQGYLSIYKNNGTYDSDPPEIQRNNEPYTGGTSISYTGTNLSVGSWQCLEMYVKFSTSQDGIFRIWKDGTLISEDTSHNTMVEATSKSTFVYFMSWWNGGSPAAQNEWVDDIVITNEKPANQDSHGNYMIGPDNYTSQQPLSLPEGLKIAKN